MSLASSIISNVVSANTWIEFDGGELSVDSSDAPLHQVIREIGEIVGFDTVLIGDFSRALAHDISFKQLTPQQAIERLVGAENRIIVYAPAGETEGKSITQVLLLQAGDTQVELPLDDSHSIASGSKRDVNGYKLASLTRLLQPEHAVVVRERAALALGNFDDERAVLALEFALSDHTASVRRVAISSLGRIGNEQASETLTNFLRDDNTSVPDRTAATSAISRHDTTIAHEFLRAEGNLANRYD